MRVTSEFAGTEVNPKDNSTVAVEFKVEINSSTGTVSVTHKHEDWDVERVESVEFFDDPAPALLKYLAWLLLFDHEGLTLVETYSE